MFSPGPPATVLVGSKLAADSTTKMESQSGTTIYIGSTAEGEAEGIHVGQWNARSGTIEQVRLAYHCTQPSFQAIGRLSGGHYLFSGHQPTDTVAALSSFRIAPSGDIELVSTIEVGDEPESFVQIGMDHTQTVLFSASYRTSKIRSFKISPDGQLSGPISEFTLTGSGPNPKRQTTAHAHGAVVSPENRFVLVNDLGADRIMIYKLDASSGTLEPNTPAFYHAKPGSGPRHTAFHPNGKFAYSINELDSTITEFTWDSAGGVLNPLGRVRTTARGVDISKNRAGEVILDSSGKLLYACNRGAVEELLVYSVSPEGKLRLVRRTPLEGKEARHFAISPEGTYFVVAEQTSNFVSVFSRDPDTGKITSTGNKYPVNQPSCVSFA